MLGIPRDWHGQSDPSPPAFSLATDTSHLWFVAHHHAPGHPHPSAKAGCFTPELWLHDVAECFIAWPDQSYLELNLAPNAAWWACRFASPRLPTSAAPLSIPGLQCHASSSRDAGWLAAMAIPLDFFGANGLDWSSLRANVCLILGTCPRRYYSATPLPGVEPDFHQPDAFAPICHLTPPPA